MHWGIPFRRAAKRELSNEQQATMDAASERLMAIQQSRSNVAISIALSDVEVALLVEVVDDCLAECGDNTTELDLQLKTPARGEVESLVDRLRRAVPSCLSTKS
jgi:hypothetical protein